MKMKKGIIALCTMIVVLLGIYVGVRLINSLTTIGNANSQNNQVSKENESKESLDNFFNEDNEGSNNELSEAEELDSNFNEKPNNKEASETINEDSKPKVNEDSKPKVNEDSKSKVNEDLDKDTIENEQNLTTIEVFEEKHLVKNGDTLYAIARECLKKNAIEETGNLDKAVNLIILANQDVIEDENTIKEGMELLIPTESNFKDENEMKKNELGKKYKIEKGDSLYDIAVKKMPWSNVAEAVELIKELNDLKDDNILLGSTIYIPNEQ